MKLDPAAPSLVEQIALAAGLHRCHTAPQPGPAVLCGCPEGKCDARAERAGMWSGEFQHPAEWRKERR